MKYHCIAILLALSIASVVAGTQENQNKAKELQGKTVMVMKYGSTSYCLGHENFLANLIKKNKNNEKSLMFKIVPGLADKNLISFESVDKPGHYLRHSYSRLRLHADSATGPFKADATFFVETGLKGKDSISFRSFNFPSSYLAFTKKREFILKQNPKDRDASFTVKVVEEK